MSLIYLDRLPVVIRADFARKVLGIADFLAVNPDWLMQVMYAESRLRPAAANRQGTDKHLVAAGLLQFTTGSGIVRSGRVPSLEHILTMSAMDQLELVKWYFTAFRGRMKNYYDVYAVTFFPAMIGKPDHWVLEAKSLAASTIAKQNPAIAKGKPHITVADFKHYTVGLVPQSLRERVFGVVKQTVQAVEEGAEQVKESIVSHPKESTGVGAGIVIVLCVLSWYVFQRGG